MDQVDRDVNRNLLLVDRQKDRPSVLDHLPNPLEIPVRRPPSQTLLAHHLPDHLHQVDHDVNRNLLLVDGLLILQPLARLSFL